MKIYNSLTRRIEEFSPINPPRVGVYACGPTVYFYPHIGNWRTFVLGDLVVRALKYSGFEVDYVMNITDVGHLTGDNLGDASSGEDRLEASAKREGRTAWDVAKFYTEDFLASYEKLNLTKPKVFSKATENISEQIEMVVEIEVAGFTYKTTDGIYFDVGKYVESGNEYGLMSNIHMDESEARIAENKEKKDKRDFALWKFSPTGVARDMEWESPWGVGFPGWHIECSAMARKYLGAQFDVHIGGEDHKSTHHPNEIAQSEAANGKRPFVKYWMHGAFLQVDGRRMGKSLGNAFTIADVEGRGFDPLALRYFYLTGHYRDNLNFTWEALEGASRGLKKLRDSIGALGSRLADEKQRTVLSDEKMDKVNEYKEKFSNAIERDLNTPQAVAIVWEAIKSNIPDRDKLDLVLSFDEVLGLGLAEVSKLDVQETRLPKSGKILSSSFALSSGLIEKLDLRELAKAEKDFEQADLLRAEIESSGVILGDGAHGPLVKKK